MRKRDGEASVSSILTVYFDGQFWVGVAERRSAGTIEVCRIVFGAEPSNEKIYQLVRDRWASLPFSAGIETDAAPRHAGNPKRRQREAAREAKQARPSSKAQEALALEREASKDEAADRRAERERATQRERYEHKREKRKRKHKGDKGHRAFRTGWNARCP